MVVVPAHRQGVVQRQAVADVQRRVLALGHRRVQRYAVQGPAIICSQRQLIATGTADGGIGKSRTRRQVEVASRESQRTSVKVDGLGGVACAATTRIEVQIEQAACTGCADVIANRDVAGCGKGQRVGGGGVAGNNAGGNVAGIADAAGAALLFASDH